VNSLGVIVEAHQSGQGGDGIFWRVGHLTDPNAGKFTITWDSGVGGTRYDKGINPKISVKDDNDVVEVHGVNGEAKLHPIRGKVYLNRQVVFETEHPRLESEGWSPNVALLNNSSILEVNRRSTGIVYRTGALDPSGTGINWSEPQLIDGTKTHHLPAVAANATDAVVTFRSEDEGFFRSMYLRYSTAKLP
jgi:hypothetical protein